MPPTAERDDCDAALGELRSDREDLLPAPAETLDATVTEWIDRAEELVFECDGDRFAEGVSDLDALADQIDAGLAEL